MAYFDYNGKQIFYTETGEGEPCVFLHGNTASSKMFEFILPLYTADVKVILIDFWETENRNGLRNFPMNCGLTRGIRLWSCVKR